MDLQKVMASVDKEALITLAMDLVNIPSPTGEEHRIAEFVAHRYRSLGLRTRLQEIEPNRYNVLGILEGDGTGVNLMFNGHMDTSYSGKEEYLAGDPAHQPKAYIEGDAIRGLGIWNMKGSDAAYIAAVQAVRKAGITLRGDVTLAAVAGEIEKGSVDGYQGAEYRGAGAGTRYLVIHGGTADMAVLGEPTAFHVVPATMGYVFSKITVRGKIQHTAFVTDHSQNAISKTATVIRALEAWIPKYRSAHPYRGAEANVNITAIQGGWPTRSRTPLACGIFVDTRILPGQHPLTVKRELEGVLNTLRGQDPHLDADLEVFMTNPGTEISDGEPVVQATMRAHRAVFGTEPRLAVEGWSSDGSILNRHGIPSVNYGPPGIYGQVRIDDLYRLAQAYACIIADLCTVTRDEVLGDRHG